MFRKEHIPNQEMIAKMGYYERVAIATEAVSLATRNAQSDPACRDADVKLLHEVISALKGISCSGSGDIQQLRRLWDRTEDTILELNRLGESHNYTDYIRSARAAIDAAIHHTMRINDSQVSSWAETSLFECVDANNAENDIEHLFQFYHAMEVVRIHRGWSKKSLMPPDIWDVVRKGIMEVA